MATQATSCFLGCEIFYLGFSRLENLWLQIELVKTTNFGRCFPLLDLLQATNIIPNFTRVLIKCHYTNIEQSATAQNATRCDTPKTHIIGHQNNANGLFESIKAILCNFNWLMFLLYAAHFLYKAYVDAGRKKGSNRTTMLCCITRQKWGFLFGCPLSGTMKDMESQVSKGDLFEFLSCATHQTTNQENRIINANGKLEALYIGLAMNDRIAYTRTAHELVEHALKNIEKE